MKNIEGSIWQATPDDAPAFVPGLFYAHVEESGFSRSDWRGPSKTVEGAKNLLNRHQHNQQARKVIL